MRACRVRILTRVLARRHLLCVRSRRVCAFTSARVQPSCVRVHERACASTSRVRRVRVVTSVIVHEPDKIFITSRGTKPHHVFQQAYYPIIIYVCDSNRDRVA